MAANAAVSALLKPTSEHGRNVFPLDNKQVYSQKAGQIVPVKAFHFMPNDYFDIKASDFTLTFPMQTAPFLRGRKEFSFYSVYYNAIWSLFNQYQGQKSDPKTSAFGTEPKLVEPRVRLYDLYGRCYSQWLFYMVYEHFIPAIVPEVEISTRRRLFLDDLFKNSTSSSSIGLGFNVQYAYNQTTYSFGYTHTEFSTQFPSLNYGVRFSYPKGYSEDNMTIDQYVKDVVGHWRAYNYMRKLDMLGYGNIYPICSEAERQIIYTLSGSQTLAQKMSSINAICKQLLQRIIFMTWNNPTNAANPVAKMVNAYPICAYNLVFYHFFRNSYYDLDYNPRDYNLDFISINAGSATGLIDPYYFTLRFLDIEYHQWKKDTFTAVLPDTQFGAVASIDLSFSGRVPISGTATLTGSTGIDRSRWYGYNGALTENSNLQTASVVDGKTSVIESSSRVNIVHDHLVSGSAILSSDANVSFSSAFDVISLKRAEMLQEYRQQLMRAGNRTSDVFRALYGSSASSEHEDDVIPRFLETFGEDIFVDPVTATANTGSENLNGQLGDLASRAKMSGSSNHIKFNAGGNFGVILCLSYVVPTAEYNSYMIDPHIKELTPQAHYIPQFDKYGLEPVYSDELNCLYDLSTLAVLGYAPAYHYKKSEVDKVHGAFCSLISNDRRSATTFRFAQIDYLGEFNNWVSPRTDMQSRKNTLVRDFYINPSVLDNVFVRSAGADQADDQFICNTYFEVMSTRGMSKVGLIDFV